MHNHRNPVIALAFCLLAGRASAESLNIKPGLWEITSLRESKGTPPIPVAERAEMEKKMAQMPPEMRAKIEAAMKGAALNSATPVVKNSCILKEDLNKSLEFVFGRGDGACTRTIVQATSTLQEIRVECSKGTQKSGGTLKMAAPNPESWTSTMNGSVSDTGGATEMKLKMSAKWLSADCGNVKPASPK